MRLHSTNVCGGMMKVLKAFKSYLILLRNNGPESLLFFHSC